MIEGTKNTIYQEVSMAVTVLISDQRRAYQGRIDALTDSKTKFEIYEH